MDVFPMYCIPLMEFTLSPCSSGHCCLATVLFQFNQAQGKKMFTPRHGTWNRSGGKGNSLTQQHLFFGIRWYYEWYVPLQARVKNDDDQLNLGQWLPSWGKLLWPWRHQFTRCTSPGSARPSWNIFPNVKIPSTGQDLSKHHSVKRSSYSNGTNLSFLITVTSKKWADFSRSCKFCRCAVTSCPCLFAVPRGMKSYPVKI